MTTSPTLLALTRTRLPAYRPTARPTIHPGIFAIDPRSVIIAGTSVGKTFATFVMHPDAVHEIATVSQSSPPLKV